MLILFVRIAALMWKEVVHWDWIYYIGGILGVLFLISICDELNDRFKRIPFGPMRLPVIGNRIQLWALGGNRPFVAITRLARSYRSGFMKIFFGLNGYISANGHERVTGLLEEDAGEWLGERDPIWRLDRTSEEKKEVDLGVWSGRRNVAIKCLERILLSRREPLNGLIRKQVGDLLTSMAGQERVDRKGWREVSAETFLPYVVSSVWSVLTGNDHVEVTERRVQTIHRCLKDWEEKSVELGNWEDLYPFMVRWFPGWTGYEKLQEVNHDFRKVLKCLIKEQYRKAAEGVPSITGPSYVQACIREFKELRKSSFTSAPMNDSSSIALLFEFLCPGPLLTSSHAAFAISFAARSPQAQERIYREILEVWGEEVVPVWEESKVERMPYTSAFILEALRLGCPLPLERRKLLRSVREGGCGTRFPKDLPLLLNYHSANMDPKVWERPEEFRPERFLDPQEGKVVGEERLVSLTVERNLCAGQPLLKMILFSFVTGVVQRWRLELWQNWKDKGASYGVHAKPQPLKVILHERREKAD